MIVYHLVGQRICILIFLALDYLSSISTRQ